MDEYSANLYLRSLEAEMEDTELELAAARAMKMNCCIDDGQCWLGVKPLPEHIVRDSVRWQPLSDWRDTGQCWAYLRKRFGEVIVRTEHDMDREPYRVVVLEDPFSPDDVNHNISLKTESDQEAIVRAVVAVRGGDE